MTAELTQALSFEGHNLRLVNRNDETWWVARDVCNILGHTNTSTALAELDDDEKAKESLALGRGSKANIINEPGLYRLMMRSRKPAAKRFVRWITHEVLPSIHRTGAYLTEPAANQLEQLLQRVKQLESQTGIPLSPVEQFAAACNSLEAAGVFPEEAVWLAGRQTGIIPSHRGPQTPDDWNRLRAIFAARRAQKS